MPNHKETMTPELIAAVKEAVENTTGVDFKDFLNAYQETNADIPDLTEADLVAEILEAGGYQHEDDNTFEDAVMIGAYAIGSDLGLL